MKTNHFFKLIFKNKMAVTLYIVFVVISSFLSLGLSYLTYCITSLAQSGTKTQIIKLGIFAIIYLIIYGVIYGVKYYLKNLSVNSTMKYLKNKIIGNIMDLNYIKFSQRSKSEYISIMTNDLNVLEENYYSSYFDLCTYIVTFVFTLIAFLYFNVYITIWIFFMIFLMLKLPKLFERKLTNKMESVSENNAKVILSTKDTLNSYEFSRCIDDRKFIVSKYSNSINKLIRSYLSFIKEKATADGVAVALSWLMSTGTFIIAGYFVIDGTLEVAMMFALVQLMSNLSNPLINILELINEISSTKSIRAKCEEYLILEKEIKDEKNIEFNDSINLNNVTFHYDNKPNILNNFNFQFKKGKKYLVLGASGSGKSTLLRLLNKSYENYSGEILLDNQNYKSISVENLANIISYVPQNVNLINDSIYNNVTLFHDEYSDEELKKIYQVTGIDKIISNLKDYDQTLVEEDGDNLSGGEKQRIAIARALIKKNKVILLDEITSALDMKISAEIESIIMSLKDITVINVSHKIDRHTINMYDNVLIFSDDNIIVKDEIDFDDIQKLIKKL